MELHNEIMNLQEPHGVFDGLNDEQRLLYKIAFRDARHAAAELSLKYDCLKKNRPDYGP